MTKKEVKKKKKTSRKKTTSKKETKKENKKETIPKKPKLPEGDIKLEKILIENFVGLQKVMVNLSSKFEELSGKISQLLEIFEISAKALAEKDLTIEQTARDDSKIIQEIGNLSEQNKIIAKGLTLMHNKLSGEPEPLMENPNSPNFQEESEDEEISNQSQFPPRLSKSRTFEPRFPGDYEDEAITRPSESEKIPDYYQNQKTSQQGPPNLQKPLMPHPPEIPKTPENYENQRMQRQVPSTPQTRPLQKPVQNSAEDSSQTIPIKNSMEGYQKSIASGTQEQNPST